MTNQMDQDATVVERENAAAVFTQEDIKNLKGRLEEKQARSHGTAHWKRMIEDCDLILEHLESKGTR